MFTLGDVADILDSALYTGISIVDALEKLSEAAEEGSLDRKRIFEDLNITDISETITPSPKLQENGKTNFSYDSPLHPQEQENIQKIPEYSSFPLVSFSPDIEAKIALYLNNNNNIVPSQTSPSPRTLEVPKDVKVPPGFQLISSNASSTHQFSNVDNSDFIDLQYGSPRSLQQQVTSPSEIIANSKNEQLVPHETRKIEKDKSKRPGTFVLDTTSVVTVQDAQRHGLPIIEALGDLAKFTGDFMKDCHTADEQTDIDGIPPLQVVDDSNECDVDNDVFTEDDEKREKLENMINSRVTEILQSFQQLDVTMDQLSRQAIESKKSRKDELKSSVPSTTLPSLPVSNTLINSPINIVSQSHVLPEDSSPVVRRRQKRGNSSARPSTFIARDSCDSFEQMFTDYMDKKNHDEARVPQDKPSEAYSHMIDITSHVNSAAMSQENISTTEINNRQCVDQADRPLFSVSPGGLDTKESSFPSLPFNTVSHNKGINPNERILSQQCIDRPTERSLDYLENNLMHRNQSESQGINHLSRTSNNYECSMKSEFVLADSECHEMNTIRDRGTREHLTQDKIYVSTARNEYIQNSSDHTERALPPTESRFEGNMQEAKTSLPRPGTYVLHSPSERVLPSLGTQEQLLNQEVDNSNMQMPSATLAGVISARSNYPRWYQWTPNTLKVLQNLGISAQRAM